MAEGNGDRQEGNEKNTSELQLVGECPKCEGDLIATDRKAENGRNLAQCKNCGYEEPV